MTKTRKKGGIAVRVPMDKAYEKYAKNANHIGVIEYLGSKDVDMCEVSFRTDDKTFEKVSSIGRALIKDDKHKLFGYAIVRAIEEVIAEEKKKRGKKCSRD